MGRKFGGVLSDLRKVRGLTVRGLARLVFTSPGYISEMERGLRHPSHTFAAHLDLKLEAGGVLSEAWHADVGSLGDPDYGIRSHKFLPAYIGPAAAAALVAELDAREDTDQWLSAFVAPVEHPDGDCELWLFPHGVAIFHLTEDEGWTDLASLARWRYASNADNIPWASRHLSDLLGTTAAVDYVLSMYWVHSCGWIGERLETAMRILTTPRILTGPDGVDMEHRYLTEGWSDPGVVGFGQTGRSMGYASWSGVTYHPLAPACALLESELVACELAVQSVWQYASWICGEVEAGRDPRVPADYGWRFLRGARSRLGVARPQETAAHSAMRTAVLSTSTLDDMLSRAVESLRDAA